MGKANLKVVDKKPQKRVSYTLRSNNKTLLTTPFKTVAEQAATHYFGDLRSVSMLDNSTKKTMYHWIYGRLQEKKK